MPRKLCNYANASSETPKKGALYQRGQYYIIENNDRKGDRRRYSVFINDSMIGMGGSLARMKRFVNQMYGSFPFETDVSESIEKKVKTFSRLAQMTLRSEMKPSKTKAASVQAKKSKAKATPKKNPGAKKTKPLVSEALKPKAKKSKAEPKAKVKAGTMPTRTSQGKLNKKQADTALRDLRNLPLDVIVQTQSTFEERYIKNNHYTRVKNAIEKQIALLKTKKPTQGSLF